MKKICTFLFMIVAAIQLAASDINWSFPPDMISTASQNGSDQEIAMDASGNVVAVWVESGLVKARTKLTTGSWSTTVTLSATNATAPRVVADANGNATAVWLEGSIVKASSKPFGGNWSSVSTLSSSGAASPDLAVDVAGDVITVWARNGDVQSSTKLFGGNWGTTQTINSTGSVAPRIAIGGSGSSTRAFVVWHGVSGSTNVVYASTKLISGTWSTQLAISDTTHHAVYAHVAADANANATAVWYSYDVTGTFYSGVTVQSASRLPSGSWTPPASLSAPGLRNPADLAARVRYDANGNAIAVWSTSFDRDGFNIQSAVKPVKKEWTAAIELVPSNPYAYRAALDVSSLGDALAVYMFYNGVSLIIQSAEADITGFIDNFWSVPINLSQGTSNGYPRSVAVQSGNTIYTAAVWLNFDGTNNLVHAVTGTRQIILPPTNVTVTQNSNNFGIFTEYYNTISWTASTSPNVIGYAVFRDGVFLERVEAGTTQVIDHNTTQNGAVTYGVVAIDKEQAQSRIINATFP